MMLSYGTRADGSGSSKIVWKVNLYDPTLASVRYRCIYPAHALERSGWKSVILERDETISDFSNVGALVLVKTFEKRDVEMARLARLRGIPIFYDLCDNIFVEAYGGSRHHLIVGNFLKIAELCDAISTTTEPLADLIARRISSRIPVVVVPDTVETPELGALSLDMALCGSDGAPRVLPVRHPMGRSGQSGTVVWFGNAGSSHGTYGLRSLCQIAPSLLRCAERIDLHLLIVSNDRNLYRSLVEPLPLRSSYMEWDLLSSFELIASANVCVLPNSRDDFSKVKSANRALLSLHLGTPVVATSVPALQPLADCIILDDFEGGIQTYIEDLERREQDLGHARKLLASTFSLPVIGERWLELLQTRSAHA